MNRSLAQTLLGTATLAKPLIPPSRALRQVQLHSIAARSRPAQTKWPSSSQPRHNSSYDYDEATRAPPPSALSRLSGATIVLACIPLVAFALGSWQIKRLRWKVALIDELEEKLQRDTLRLPRKVNPEAIPEFAWRKVYVEGEFDHSKEILLGPRTKDNVLGYFLITPLRREGGETILVNRGFVPREKMDQSTRPESLTAGLFRMVGMLRTQDRKNMFTPPNSPERGQWNFADIDAMAHYCGASPVLVDDIFEGHAGESAAQLQRGIPVGRSATIELRNMHATYAVTWYALSAITAVMLVRLLRRAPARGKTFANTKLPQ
ncbi:uncharacterized protein L969DRAFT_84203 [Mixia osmundae IAM 14324]|uniref:SURF1-like protein n=1 Tax=Mixia osmundae (strain CBS 9802 / IAM 14324 / JCM 22182 / KY 12970) TaxID=764103 RepID=G7EAJ8_MIXOS|nr:uncharacterized protein L969DRAFT_84203 [Mixia osmundae IAM 14324]KEI42348.1 hypothetical protein L969DRAFT_84203 [Mixia osmundae IAM 14324]GAA99858.1 hypothetical protein E5Q_06561 [Mixia osmundae IAM 14324]